MYTVVLCMVVLCTVVLCSVCMYESDTSIGAGPDCRAVATAEYFGHFRQLLYSFKLYRSA